MFQHCKYVNGKNNYTKLNLHDMPKVILYNLVVFVFFLSACEKSTIISTQTRDGKIYGYSSQNFAYGVTVDFGTINHRTGLSVNVAQIKNQSSVYNQAMYLPSKNYIVPTGYSFVPSTTNTQLKRVNTVNNTIDSISSLTTDYLAGLTYSPSTQKMYAIEQDTLFDFTIDENLPKRIVKDRKIKLYILQQPNNFVSSTAHGYLPKWYGASVRSLISIDLITGLEKSIKSELDTVSYYYGIRYNQHDSMVYFLQEVWDSTFQPFEVNLMKLNPLNDEISFVVNIPQLSSIGVYSPISLAPYAATIHCCENVYCLNRDNKFYNINIGTKQIEVVPTSKVYQGLIWVNE